MPRRTNSLAPPLSRRLWQAVFGKPLLSTLAPAVPPGPAQGLGVYLVGGVALAALGATAALRAYYYSDLNLLGAWD